MENTEIIKVTEKQISIDGTEETILPAFAALVITLLSETLITPATLVQVFTKAVMYTPKKEDSEGSDTE